MNDNIWQFQAAKSKFSQLVKRAMLNEPQFVIQNGNKAVIIISFAEYEKITQPQTDLITFLRTSSLIDTKIDTKSDVSRNHDYPREIEL